MNTAPVSQHAGPPLLRRPHPSLVKRGTQHALKRAYIYGVAPNNTMPTSCAVVIDNNPPINGFTLPAGFGLVYRQHQWFCGYTTRRRHPIHWVQWREVSDNMAYRRL